MHAPDGFLNATTAVGTGAISAGTIAVAVRQSREQLADSQVPVAGLAAAFVFAAQMVNFPVAAGTTGHLLGGGLAAVLLGPWVGALVVTVVVLVQALVFADGGLTALGYNVLNMAIVTAFGGWAVFRLLRRALPSSTAGISLAAGIAAGVSVVLSSMAFSLEWLFGATAPIAADTVFASMVGVHTLIGIGEGVITGLVVSAVLASRPDLVRGADGLDLESRKAVGRRGFLVGGAVVSLVIATIVAQLAGSAPDGLERVAQNQGFLDSARDHAFGSGLFADYATQGIGNEALSLAVAGLVGTVLTLLVGAGLFLAVRDRRRDGPPARGA